MSKNYYRSFLPISLMLVNASCSVSTPTPGSQFAMEELVLIEFAARLEEDYHRLHPGGSRSSFPGNKSGTTPPVDIDSSEHEPVTDPLQYEPAHTPNEK